MITAVIVGLITVVAFGTAKRLPGGDRLFLYGDYYVQYMQFIKLFLRNLTGGGSLFYSFEVSMGMPTWPLYAYESLSPFNFWFLAVSDADTAAFLVVLNKLMLCGAAFCLFSERTMKTPAWCAVSLGCIYALCGYNISFYYNVQYLDGVYLLPVLILLLHRFVRTGRVVLLTLVYAFSFIVLFYSGYMLGVFSFVMWIALAWYEYGKERSRYLQNAGRFALCIVCSVLLSAVVTLPVLMFLLRNTPEDATVSQSLNVDIVRLLISIFPGQAQKIDSRSPAIYSGLVSLAAVPYFFLDRRREKREKVLALIPLLFLLLCTFFPPAYRMIHGFDATDLSHFRFAYMYSFVFLAITARVLGRSFAKDRCTNTKRVLWIPVVIAAELLLHGYFALTPDTKELPRSADYYHRWNKEGKQAMEQIALSEEEQPDAFYRIYYENAMEKNSAAYFGYHGIGYFSSLEQPALRNALYRLGYNTTPRAVADYGSTPFTRMLFAQKYTVHGTNPLYEKEDAFGVRKEPQYLLPAFMVSDRLVDFVLSGEDVFQNQNALACAMIGQNVELFEKYAGEVRSHGNGADVEQAADGYRVSCGNGAGGWYSYALSPEHGRRLYAYFSQDRSLETYRTAKIGTNADIGLPLSTSYLSAPHILPVAEDGEIRILIGEKDVQTSGFQDMYFYYLREDGLDTVYRDLADGNCYDLQFAEDRISFDVTATKEKSLLFTSVPYDPGWEVTVDGIPSETMAVLNNAFLAVPLLPGTHHIHMQFQDRTIAAGGILSLIGCVLTAVLCIRKAACEKHDRT